MRRFPTVTGLARGYDRKQVDTFLTFIEQKLADDRVDGDGVGGHGAGGPVTTSNIRRVGFDLVRGGYQVAAVDARLDVLEERALGAERRRPSRPPGRSQRAPADILDLLRSVLSAPRGARLPRCGPLRLGYLPGDVDSYLERLPRALAGEGEVSASEVRRTTFRARRGGYDEASVDDLLDEVIDALLRRRVG